jgi:hypothetical protein
MIASGYTLDLYCDVPVEGWEHLHQSEFSHGPGVGKFYAEEGRTARADARRAGWKFNMRTGVAICPTCAKAGRAPIPEAPAPGHPAAEEE